MSMLYIDLQNEVKRRSVRDQGGTQFDTAIQNIINSSLFRVSRDSLWRTLRRRDSFETVTTYNTGSGGGTFTNDSKSITMVGATFLTDGIVLGRRITLQGSSKRFTIESITGETTLTLDVAYSGTTISGTGTYSILPQDEYNLPIQAGTRSFLWHDDYGYPFQMRYVTDQDFYSSSVTDTNTGTPIVYRSWEQNMVIVQPKQASVVTVSSSESGDTNIPIEVFGTVSSFPDSETITTNGTTTVAGSKAFTYIDRIVKASTTTGRITITSDSALTTVAVIPTGDITAGIKYTKVNIFPLPNRVFPINVQYYKEPYRLVNDNDVHELGQEFDEIIILLSVAKIKYENNQKEGDQWFGMYNNELANLRKTNVDKIDWYPKLRRGGVSGGIGQVHEFLGFQQVGSDFGRRSRF